MVRLRWLSAALGFGLALACSSSSTNPAAGGTGGSDAGDASATGGAAGTTGGTGGADAGANDADAAPGCPPDMADMGDFCIDKHEVTYQQYTSFVINTQGAGQGGECAWNTSWGPATSADDALCNLTQSANLPVTCVDYCDAKGYCEYADPSTPKRLCGLRHGGGPIAPAEATNATLNEWFYACSNGGKTAYPYGDVYDDTKCAVGTLRVNVGSYPDCKGTSSNFDQVLDMSGNAAEWVDTCQTPAGDEAQTLCLTRGGAGQVPGVTVSPESFSCAGTDAGPDAGLEAAYEPRSFVNPHVGFRCCMTKPTGG